MIRTIQMLTLYVLSLALTASAYCALFLSKWEALVRMPNATTSEVIFGVLTAITQTSFPVFVGLVYLSYLLDSKPQGIRQTNAVGGDVSTPA